MIANTRSMIIPAIALIVALHLCAGELGAQPQEPSGTAVGTVREITRQFVLLQATGDSPRRYYFKWIVEPTSVPDAALQASAAAFKPSERVQIRWTFDGDRRRIESIATAPAPPPLVAASTDPAATTAPAPVSAERSTASKAAGDTVNAILDDLLAFGERVLSLPLLLIMPAVGIAGVLSGLGIRRLWRSANRGKTTRRIIIVEAVLGALLVLFIIDRKISLIQIELTELRSRHTADTTAMLATSRRPPRRETLQFNADEVAKLLAPQFGQVTLKPLIADDATDIVQLRTAAPYTQTFIAVVDLRDPGVQVKIGANLQTKSLTSAFARQNNCTVAINGEAGSSPMSWSGLGVWRGNLLVDGKSLLVEQPSNPRPFIAFDQKNRAAFTSASAAERKTPPDAYNVIWGRSDALVDGIVQTFDARDRQPRTAMGLSRDGGKLYLLVADGRQPRYSNGLTRAEVGTILKSFGAASAMLCDEGGSSCIYVKPLGGIANIPSDNQGQERPTYTHFGITRKVDS